MVTTHEGVQESYSIGVPTIRTQRASALARKLRYLCCSQGFVAQWLERPVVSREGEGSIPFGTA